MSIFARVADGVVAELFDEADGLLSERFQAEFVAGLIEAPDGVEPGWRIADGQFQPPAPPEVPALAILSVLPVALRRALRNTPAPAGEGDALAYVLGALSASGLEDARDAFEYMVRAERADMIALGGPLGLGADAVDSVLALAATYPGSDARWGPAPTSA